jgi:hypothetical protein
MRTTIAILAALLCAAPLALAHAQEQEQEQAQGTRRPEPQTESRAQHVRAAPRDDHGVNEQLLSGRFELAGTRQEAEAELNRGIERAVADMSFMTRGIAADRLREKNPIRSEVTTEVRGDRIAIRYGDARYETRSGEWETVTATGEQVELLQTASGNEIFQTFRAPDGEKTTVYRFSPDGQRLTLDITVTSPRLSQPMRYSVEYRRVGGERPIAER